jgi:hypothetical protein
MYRLETAILSFWKSASRAVWLRKGRTKRRAFTLPESISFYRNTPFNKPVETQSGGLQGATHRTSDYALDLVGERQMLTKMLLERGIAAGPALRVLGRGYRILVQNASGMVFLKKP